MTGRDQAYADPVRVQHPAAMLTGPGHVIAYGNDAFLAEFGAECIGLPAQEALVSFPREAFDLLERVRETGIPRKRRVVIGGRPRSLTVAPRIEIGGRVPYGVMFHVVPRDERAGRGSTSPGSRETP